MYIVCNMFVHKIAVVTSFGKACNSQFLLNFGKFNGLVTPWNTAYFENL